MVKILPLEEWPVRKSHKRAPGRPPATVLTHFGVRVQSGSRHGLRIERATYATINKRSSVYAKREWYTVKEWESASRFFEDDDHRIYTDEWCAAQQEAALRN